MITKGNYLTKGGYQARLNSNITSEGLGIVRIGKDIRYVTYNAAGEFAYKESYRRHENDPGDSLDLVLEPDALCQGAIL